MSKRHIENRLREMGYVEKAREKWNKIDCKQYMYNIVNKKANYNKKCHRDRKWV